MAVDRLVIASEESFEDQLTAAIETEADLGSVGSICISVAEEQAVDTRNAMIECSIHLTRAQAAQLRDWLSLHLL